MGSQDAAVRGSQHFWDERFTGDVYRFGTEPNSFACTLSAVIPPRGKVLSVADGEGRNGVYFAQQGFSVEAFDVSPIGVAKAKRLARLRGVPEHLYTPRTESVFDYQWPSQQYDAVVAIFIQFANPQQRAVIFDGMIRATRPGGVVAVLGYRPEQLAYGTGGPPEVSHLYTESLLREAFSSCQITHIKSYDPVLSEGVGHDGKSAVIEMIAIKS